MKYTITTLVLLLSLLAVAQTGTVEGTLIDESTNGEPLPFANIIIKGTQKGTTSDFDGNYILEDLPVGTYTLEFSFVGYETIEVPNVTVTAGTFTRADATLSASAAALDEVVIKVQTSREREEALLIEQKKAVAIRESIGSQELGKLGVSDASGATTKISGVSKTDGSGAVFVRGLGDRYLYTTLNGLPIPSNNIEKKNIDLSLFPTRIIQSIDVSKTNAAHLSADQASGNINIASKELSGSQLLTVGTSTAVNTNVAGSGAFGNFKVSANNSDVTAGFYNKGVPTFNAITAQSWDPQQAQLPVNGSVSVSAGKRMGEKLRVLLTLGQSSSYEHTNGVFRQYRSNFIDDTIPDATYWKKYTATSALANVGFRPNDGNKLKFVSLYINTLEDQVFEGGRAGTATIFEETDPAEGLFQFIRDQNTKTTLLAVNQLAGEHTLDERNTLHWAVGYNYLKADEPNRIRNEVNFNPTTVQLGRTGGFQQRKGLQKITDVEHNARVHDKLKIMDHQTSSLHIGLGGNYRSKRRNFGSQFFGVEETSTNAINPESIDRISEIFTQQNFDNGLLKRNTLQPDVYDGLLESAAGFIDVTGVYSKFSFQAGLRYQRDAINVNFNVGNVPGRAGSASKQYARLYPSVNLKYAFTEKVSLRFANSITVTLPEFKEIAPFEYISQTGQVTRGNPNIEASRNHNYDLKFEYFPSNGQLLSLTGFYKKIDDPINKMQDRGAAGVFSYFNVGEKAEVMGIELETKANVINGKEKGTPNLALRFNATRMWHTQGLKDVFADNGTFVRSFRYKGLKKTGLQGASDWILNTSINLSTNGENPIEVSLSGTYSSDKIFALGSPEEQTTSDINYNDAIVEKGFVALNLILNKRINNHWNVGFSGKNLLDPQIKRTQLVRPSTTGIETEQTVQSYTRGVGLGINLNYTF